MKEKALRYHSYPKPGKTEICVSKEVDTQEELSLAYTPGVAEPCLEIEKDPSKVYDYTSKGNLVAVISNGTAVLGLGDIGALASKPVMEGKAVLFKKFANINSFDIEVNEKDVDKFCETIKAISPTFGGINLEDIKAPECFEIERRLIEELDIPVMHDDQHGTAVISTAAIINATYLNSKDIKKLKVVIVGAGAAAISCGRLYRQIGIENILMLDSKGLIHKNRDDLNTYKKEFAYQKHLSREEIFKDADVVLGLSRPGSIRLDDISLMAREPIVFTLANPTPELFPDEIKSIRDDAIIATGRSDFSNQVNNVLGFPFIFRGALDVRAKKINTEMKLSAAKALADLARKDVPDYIKDIYKTDLKFSKEYIIPSIFDKRLLGEVSSAVAKAAVDSGVAGVKEFDINSYKHSISI